MFYFVLTGSYMISTEIHQMYWRIITGAGFRRRGIVTDNHGANVTTFSIRLCENEGDKYYIFKYPEAD